MSVDSWRKSFSRELVLCNVPWTADVFGGDEGSLAAFEDVCTGSSRDVTGGVARMLEGSEKFGMLKSGPSEACST